MYVCRSQLESEDAMNILRKKHQDALLEYHDQVENLQKKNAKIDRERQRLQHEVIELTATIDQVQKEKVSLQTAAIESCLMSLTRALVCILFRSFCCF